MLNRQFGLIGFPGGAHATPSPQPPNCPSLTSITRQRFVQPVAYNTAPPTREHACVHPRSPSLPLFLRQLLAGWPSDGSQTATPTRREWNAILFFPLWATRHTLVAHCQLTPPPPVPHVSLPVYPCYPCMMGYPLRTGTRQDSTPRLSAIAPRHGVCGDHQCDVHFVELFPTLHRPAAAVTPACQPADP